MKQSQLIGILQVKAAEADIHLNQKQAKALLGLLADIVKEALQGGEEVTLPGLATFSVVDKPERQGRDFPTGETMVIHAHKAVKVKAAGELKNAVRGETA